MTASVESHPTPTGTHAAPQVEEPAAPEVGNPGLIGIPTFAVGSIALALNLTGYVDQAVVGAPIAIIAVATGMGQLLAAIWAVRLNQNPVAMIFGTFAGFWLSYAALVFGLLHNWYGLTPESTGDTVKTFLLSWLIVIVLITLASLRLPLAFTVLFVLVDAALLFVFLAYVNETAGVPSSGQLKIGGYFAFGFVAVGAYLFLDAMSAATGGKNLPLGTPILH